MRLKAKRPVIIQQDFHEKFVKDGYKGILLGNNACRVYQKMVSWLMHKGKSSKKYFLETVINLKSRE